MARVKKASREGEVVRRLRDALAGGGFPSGPVAVALSGGLDSVLLAGLLHETGKTVTALHFNHRWRGRSSGADEVWVRRWCRDRGIPCVVGAAESAGVNGETAAREERYRFLLAETRRCGAGSLWLGHHADDWVETFLLQLGRGAGLDGLFALRPVREREGVWLCRPWLPFWKEELAAAAGELGWTWREDRTNRDVRHARNAVRHRLIPLWSRLVGRDIRVPILRLIRQGISENEDWERRLPKRWPESAPVELLRKRSDAWQRRWIRGWLKARQVADISHGDIEAVRGLLHHLRPARVNLSQGWFCRRRAGRLFLEIPPG
jgi:tRNA(Ile)-lysidine synthase